MSLPPQEFLEIAGVSIANLVPRADKVTLSYPRSITTDVTLNGKRVQSGAANVQGAVITLEAGIQMYEAFKDAIDGAWLGGNSFTLRENLTKRSVLRAWLGASFSAEPQIVYVGEDAQGVYWALKNALVIYAGVAT